MENPVADQAGSGQNSRPQDSTSAVDQIFFLLQMGKVAEEKSR